MALRQFRSFVGSLENSLQRLLMPELALAGVPAWQPNRFQSWQNLDSDSSNLDNAVWQMNRNKRVVKKSNHGARPCNSVGRKSRSMASVNLKKSKLNVPRKGHVPLSKVQLPPNW